MVKTSTLKKIRLTGVILMVIGTIITLTIFGTEPMTTSFLQRLTAGTIIFLIGSTLFMAYEIFVPAFWRGEWAPGPGHEYPSEE